MTKHRNKAASSLVILGLTLSLSMSSTRDHIRLNVPGSVSATFVDARLRNSISHQYEMLLHAGGLRAGILGTDVTAAVTPYVHAGMSFHDATDKLRAAGFKVEALPLAKSTSDPNRSEDGYGVLAHVTLPCGFTCTIDAYVVLLPNTPCDYSVVREVSASVSGRDL